MKVKGFLAATLFTTLIMGLNLALYLFISPQGTFSEDKLFYLIGCTLLTLILTIIYTLITTRTVLSPIKRLEKAMKEVGGGNLEVSLKSNNKGWAGRLYTTFNSLVKFYSKKLAVNKYVSNSTSKMLESLRTGEYTTEPVRREATIFFSDIRGFTNHSSERDPLELITTLNEIFHIQAEVITSYKGEIDKFAGDEIMALFPGPQLAFKAAIEIQQRMKRYNHKRKEPLPLGIGINYGEVVVGAIGAGELYDWTSIGHTINIGQRLCSTAEPGRIYISQSAFVKISTNKSHTEKSISVKGISKRQKVYIF